MAGYVVEIDKVLDALAEGHGKRTDEQERAILDAWDRIKKIPPAKVEKCGSFAVVREGKRMCLNCGRIIDHGYMCEACSEVD